MTDKEIFKQVREISEQIAERVSKVIVGKEHEVSLVTMAVFCGGHILLEDLPGTGKTTLVKAVSRILGCSFSRVQCTPDLLPSDIVGMNVFDQKSGEFVMRHGPVMTNVFLADEVNRAIPRTQSALLEAMEELQVTVDGVTYPLPSPFFVMATQNPVEMESTFHLPQAQMDRFLIRMSLGFLSAEEEMEMLRKVGDDIPFHTLEPLLDAESVLVLQRQIQKVYISDEVLAYIVALTEATRQRSEFRLPAGPRGSRALYRAGKAWAAMKGREYVTPDDIKDLAPYVLPHRVVLSGEARLSGRTESDAIEQLLSEIRTPGQKKEMLHG